MSFEVLPQAAARLRSGAAYRSLLEAGGAGEVCRLPAAAAGLVSVLLAEDLQRPVLGLVPHEAEALAWAQGASLAAAPGSVVVFPAPALGPYQESRPSLKLRAEESLAFDRLLRGAPTLVVATPRALLQRLPSLADFAELVRELRPGEEVDREAFVAHLLACGYERSDLVTAVGDVAVRGGVVDLFPAGAPQPVRIDLFGDEVESLRWFDPDSQRSGGELPVLRALPLSLFPVGERQARRLAERLSERLGRAGGMEAMERLASLAEGQGFPGWEALAPLDAARTCSLLELLEAPLVAALDPGTIAAELEHYWHQVEAEHAAREERLALAVPPDELLHPRSVAEEIVARAPLRIGPLLGGASGIDFRGSVTDQLHGQLPRFPREVEAARLRGERLVIAAEPEHHERLERLLADLEIDAGRVDVVEAELERGFRLPEAGLTLFAEAQLVPRRALPRRTRRERYGPFLSSLRDLKVGDYIVHLDHGIGQFVALRSVAPSSAGGGPLPATLATAGGDGPAETEVMEIVYADGRSLLLPLSRLDQVQRYSGIEGVAPRLDRLGGTSWNRTKAGIKKSLKRLAFDLLKLYAERQMAQAPAMSSDTDLLRQFEARFAFEETEDQLEAIAAIEADLERRRPMDRLLAGDVGFGKTEVAMRAAFKVVESGFQVVVLAPTTILADQHLETFKARYEGFPVRIDVLSRFRTPAEARDVRKRAAAGTIDILIGTHRLLARDVELPRLGLLVVDEEQRFGVGQKERLKRLKKDIHVLAMSATPVPRTLQLSLAGVRDLSVIETPPRDRMAVETTILPFSGEVVREAIEFEIGRGGQVFFVFNRVEGIDEMAAWLRETVANLRITVGHGQLDEAELLRRMHAFTRGEYDLLLATTIIENGIHIPRVNTMIVHHAQHFGLAQLYQLRGRVGRSDQLAYCYLLVPADRILSQTARKRLRALQEFSDLGAGFRIAARDLEIRGAGNLLGPEQSGHIVALGIETYLKMLEDAIRELKGEAVEDAPSTTLDLPLPLAIPPSYIADPNLRMEIYRKVAAADSSEEEVLAELADRFGPPPVTVRTLVAVAAIKRRAESLRIQAISLRGCQLTLRLRQDSRIDLDRLVELVARHPGAEFSPAGVLSLELASPDELLPVVRTTLEELAA